jgi:dGTPase
MVDLRQVFPIELSGVIVSTRFSHTVSVRDVSWAIATGLGLDEWLAGVIALGHDPAHCPYSHLGETILSQQLAEIGHPPYNHAEAAPHLLRKVAGLKLSFEVLRGVQLHSFFSGVMEMDVPAEYRVVAAADMISYGISDASDAAMLLSTGQYHGRMLVKPAEANSLLRSLCDFQDVLGRSDRERVDRMVTAVVRESSWAGEVCFPVCPEVRAFQSLMGFLGQEIYSRTDLPEHIDRLHRVLTGLVESDTDRNPYHVFALLTDLELERLDRVGINQFTLGELPVSDLKLLPRGDFSFLTPDLSWAKP